MKSLIAWFKHLFQKENAVSDEIVLPVANNALVIGAVTPVAPPAVQPAAAPVATVDTDKLLTLLRAFGHDIKEEWTHLVAVAKL